MSKKEHCAVADALHALLFEAIKKAVRETPELELFEHGLLGIKQGQLMAEGLCVSRNRLNAFFFRKGSRESYKFARRAAAYSGVSLWTLLHVPVERWMERGETATAGAGSSEKAMVEETSAGSDDEEPVSVPAMLTGEQVDRVRAALAKVRAGKTKLEVARVLGYPRQYVQAVVAGKIGCTAHFAGQVAAAVGGEVRRFLRGVDIEESAPRS